MLIIVVYMNMDLLGLLIAMSSDGLTVRYDLVSTVAVTSVTSVATVADATIAVRTLRAVRKNLYSTIVVVTM